MPARTLAPPHRFTVEEYYRMAETGILAPDARVELIEGQIIDMLPIGPLHSGVGTRLHALFAKVGGERWIVRSQYPVRLDDGSEPLPDLALVKPRTDFYTSRHPTPEDVFLLVEVADSSVRFDREEKLPAYARAGIIEFWLVNLVERIIEIYREPSPTGVYGLIARAQPGENIAPAAFPDAVLSVAELLSSPAATEEGPKLARE
jgi:Uma2 family endonuclease